LDGGRGVGTGSFWNTEGTSELLTKLKKKASLLWSTKVGENTRGRARGKIRDTVSSHPQQGRKVSYSPLTLGKRNTSLGGKRREKRERGGPVRVS